VRRADGAGALQGAELVGNDGARRDLTLDPLKLIEIAVEVREVESTIPAGFQSEWFSGEDDDGNEFTVTAGAGWGSYWMTLHYKGRGFVVDGREILRALVGAVNA
jgi:hypothetical protein